MILKNKKGSPFDDLFLYPESFYYAVFPFEFI